jgi:hypothetical protein
MLGLNHYISLFGGMIIWFLYDNMLKFYISLKLIKFGENLNYLFLLFCCKVNIFSIKNILG